MRIYSQVNWAVGVFIFLAENLITVHLDVLVVVEVPLTELELLVNHFEPDLVHFVVAVMVVVCPWQLVLTVVVDSMGAMVPFWSQHFYLGLPYLICLHSHPNRKRNLVAMVAEDLAVLECTM